ncbi:PCC domain-containing protein [Bradyrhizobium sp. HKCCYLS3077]|uniref:PCC domain-containing protein n=1 Tax=Bradyrhizobium sp. HKCCYLS3077 TaxID=3420761 RepID=UPI003EB7E5BE
MRSITQPGAPVAERIQFVEARGRAFTFTMEPGRPLLQAAHRGFAAQGFAGGVLEFKRGALGPFAYVMPALSKTPDYAAFYSETYRPAGVTHLTTGTMTLGIRDGAPFFHCHALWTEEGGRHGGGHILPEETIVAEPFEVEAFGLDGAIFAAEPDPETGFKLFGPVAAAPRETKAERRAFALRLRPNQDFAGCLEQFCRSQEIREARIRGGVGSTIGARFADGPIVEPFATELTVKSGAIAPGADGLEATLDIALVDYTGALAQGRLIRGDNPVLMTMELVLEVVA